VTRAQVEPWEKQAIKEGPNLLVLKWEKKVPTLPGIYLRNNPPASQVVRQDCFLIDGVLCTSGGDSSSAIRITKWRGASRMWWFGPIPKVPDDEREG